MIAQSKTIRKTTVYRREATIRITTFEMPHGFTHPYETLILGGPHDGLRIYHPSHSAAIAAHRLWTDAIRKDMAAI